MAKTFVGTVSSAKPDKSIVVNVVTRKTHPIYKKQYRVTKKFMAHDEKNEALTGDKVIIRETRPISARKSFVLDKVLERAAIRAEERVENLAVPEEAVVEKPKKVEATDTEAPAEEEDKK